MRASACLSLIAALFSSALWSPAPASAAELSLPPDMYGTYAPGGDCGKQPRVDVDKAGIHLDTAAGKRGPLPVMVSYTFVGGATYDGIQTWALVKHGGKSRWGDDKTPVLLTFNADEQRGALTAERNEGPNEPPAALDGPLSSIVQAGRFRLCGARSASAAPAGKPAAVGAGVGAATGRAAPATAAAAAVARSPAAGFASVVNALMQPDSAPEGSAYDWRHIEQAPHVTWKPLPPDMLDKPLADGNYFRRNGTVSLGGPSLKVMAAGARSMVFAHYFKNEGRPLGEDAVLAALRESGLTVTPARCAMNKALRAPTWYRLSGNGKRTAFLWIAEPRGAASPWEGFNLSLDTSLKPLTAQERAIYTDRCA